MQELYDLFNSIIEIPYGVFCLLWQILIETTYPLKMVVIIEYTVLAYFGVKYLFDIFKWICQKTNDEKSWK